MTKRRSRFLIAMVFISLICLLFLSYSSYTSYKCLDCNVLLITMDSLRSDHLGSYGYHRNTSPTIDRLADKGILFHNFIANGGLTFINLPSMISSRYPLNLRQVTHVDEFDNYFFVEQNFTTLTDVLVNEGYETSLFYWGGMLIETNFHKSFGKVFTGNDNELTNLAIKNISDVNNSKFFYWIHYFSPHSPYKPSFPYNNSFYYDNYYNSNILINKSKIFKGSYLNTVEYDYYISQYDGSINYIDDKINEILEVLEQEGLSDNTLIIISSDHGESFGEGNKLFFNHGTVSEEVIKIPLIIYNPKSKLHGQERVGQIQAIDLYPTVLEILGIGHKSKIDGASFYSMILNYPFKERVAFSHQTSNEFSLRTNAWKYIETENSFQLTRLHQKNITGSLPDLFNDDALPEIILRRIRLRNIAK